jgi:hypothetical protein
LSKTTRQEIVQSIDRSSTTDVKLKDFVRRAKESLIRFEHEECLTRFGVSQVFNRTNEMKGGWLAFVVSMAINIVMVASLEYDRSANGQYEYDTMGIQNQVAEVIELGLKGTHVIISSFTLLVCVVLSAPVAYRVNFESIKEQKQSRAWCMIRSFCSIWHRSNTGYYAIYLLFGIFALEHPLLYAFLLFDVFAKSATSQDVIKAVIVPRWSLAATLVLGIFTVYIFAFTLFLFLPRALPNNECATLLTCFQISFGLGIRNGGGVGDILDPDGALGIRFILDLAFFILVLIVLLNITFGIIIDTFADLREKRNEKLKVIHSQCFICEIHKSEFEMAKIESGASSGFTQHIKQEHSMWAYLSFIIFLLKQDRDKDDGLEHTLRQCLDANDTSWFPSCQALSLQNHTQKGVEEIFDEVKELRQRFDTMERASNDIFLVLGKMTNTMEAGVQQREREVNPTPHSSPRRLNHARTMNR